MCISGSQRALTVRDLSQKTPLCEHIAGDSRWLWGTRNEEGTFRLHSKLTSFTILTALCEYFCLRRQPQLIAAICEPETGVRLYDREAIDCIYFFKFFLS